MKKACDTVESMIRNVSYCNKYASTSSLLYLVMAGHNDVSAIDLALS